MRVIIFLLIVVGIFIRFYNLNWGTPFYFHPDERNIASSIIQLHFPDRMNPHFFAYGSFPIYINYFTGYFLNFLHRPQDLFEQAIIINRFYSALLSSLIIPSVYFIGKRLANKKAGIIAAILSLFSTGLIQFAHFGTFEMWLTFLGLWLFYFSLKLIKDSNLKDAIIAGLIFGMLMATKISSLLLLMIPLTSVTLNFFRRMEIKSYLIKTFLLVFIASTVFAILCPYVFLDFKSFLLSIQYESSVAIGTLPVFYTGEFFDTIPVVFQFLKIYPFLINPTLTIIFIPSLIYLSIKAIKTKNTKYLLLITCYLFLFLPQAFLFAKWTRYMVPTLPFMYLIIAVVLEDFFRKKTIGIKHAILSIIIFINIVFSFSYFITAFVKPDTRINASLWAKENIPHDSKILSEIYDMGIVPFNSYFYYISLFNFYDLDQNLNVPLPENEYIILPSQRILKTRLLNKNKFPVGNNFYQALFGKESKYKKIYETPCDIFCKITYLGNPVFSFEETANVFDRPTVFIFKK
ncbi:MAG: glycosyltransferase family 39 protein [Candidatus Parcubacteria bacterium]|nr:glycosyltransferase family 39 protein [Candidatus Parcubacteria bacterium]